MHFTEGTNASDPVRINAKLDHDVVPRNTWIEIWRIAASGATLICEHDGAQWQEIASGLTE
jgi:hypothetical protein